MHKGDLLQLKSLAEEGLQLRSSLYAWEEMAGHWQASLATDNQMLTAWVFYAAISIYLSGTFDYSEAWTERDILTPALGQHEIQQHVENVLNITAGAIKTTNISGLMFSLSPPHCWCPSNHNGTESADPVVAQRDRMQLQGRERIQFRPCGIVDQPSFEVQQNNI